MHDSLLADSAPPVALSHVQRHWLIWPSLAGAEAIEHQILDAAARAAVRELLARGCPLVVPRHAGNFAANSGPSGSIAAAITLPLAYHKRRLALLLSRTMITRVAPPLALSRAASLLSDEGRDDLRALGASAATVGIDFRVYGSMAWEALTGERYVTASSDADVLWRPANETQLEAGMELLDRWEKMTGRVADGEIIFGEGNAVAWREWSRLAERTTERVLVKTLHTAKLVAASEVLRLLPCA